MDISDVDECIENIRLSTEDQIILVIDAQLSEILISQIHDLPQVIAIYIYNINVDQQTQCFIKYSKIKFNKDFELNFVLFSKSIPCKNVHIQIFAVTKKQSKIDTEELF
jgi:hypothetical protein